MGKREPNGLAEYYDDLSTFELKRNALVMHKRLTSAPSVDELIQERLAPFPIRRLLDVGCGFGVTLRKLAALPSLEQAHGLTVSPVQREAAERMASSEKSQYFAASFEGPLPATYDAMVCIESLVFAEDLDRAVANLARHLTADGRLLLVEDMAVGGDPSEPSKPTKFEERYRQGFHLAHVYRQSDFERAFSRAGLLVEDSCDLTARLAQGRASSARVRATVLSWLRSAAPSRRWFNVLSAYWGGAFLERLYAQGRFAYRFYELRKATEP